MYLQWLKVLKSDASHPDSEKYLKTQLDNLSVHKATTETFQRQLLLWSPLPALRWRTINTVRLSTKPHKRLTERGGEQYDLALVYLTAFRTGKAMRTSLACILIFIQLFEGKRNSHFTYLLQKLCRRIIIIILNNLYLWQSECCVFTTLV